MQDCLPRSSSKIRMFTRYPHPETVVFAYGTEQARLVWNIEMPAARSYASLFCAMSSDTMVQDLASRTQDWRH